MTKKKELLREKCFVRFSFIHSLISIRRLARSLRSLAYLFSNTTQFVNKNRTLAFSLK